MNILRQKFSVSALYLQPVDSLRGFLTKRWSFWLALFSCVSFLVGNMVGQHGWRAFFKSVWGREAIVFEGAVPPLALIPDVERWIGDRNRHSFMDVPSTLLVPLPSYIATERCIEENHNDHRVYSVPYNGRYDGTGSDGCGGHPGIDMLAPKETPVYAVMNGIVERVEERTWGFGNTIVIRHPNVPDPKDPEKHTDLYSVYAHLGHMLVAEGDIVRKAQQIGVTGQTGFATTPHLHFQIDTATAPFHPYWPFTTSEATAAGFTFIEAVDHGLGRERAREYTVNPLAYVQAHLDTSGTPRPVYASGEKENGSFLVQTKPPPLSWRERTKSRRTAQRERRTVTSQAASKPVVHISVASSAPQPLSQTQPLSTIASVTLLHDGTFEERSEEQLVLYARGADDSFVRDVRFTGKLYLGTTFGTAEFTPAELTERDFDATGKTVVHMVVRGTKTMVPTISGAFSAMGKPMVFSGPRSAVRVSER